MPHAVTLIRSGALSRVAEYAYAATAAAGSRLIFLAGACPLNEDGTTAAAGDYAGQAAKAFENMRTALADRPAHPWKTSSSTRVLVASARQPDLVAAWGSSPGLVRHARRPEHPDGRDRPRLQRPAGGNRSRCCSPRFMKRRDRSACRATLAEIGHEPVRQDKNSRTTAVSSRTMWDCPG